MPFIGRQAKGEVVNKTFSLDDDLFWRWMEGAFKSNASGISKCMTPMRDSYIDPQYIIQISSERNLSAGSSIIDKLRKYMPTGYFYEIHYCISIYASILGRIFPPLASDIEQLGYIEWLQFTEPLHENYRDHLVHFFKVAFVSDTFLFSPTFLSSVVSCQAKSGHFKKWCKEQKIPLSKWEDDGQFEDVIKVAFFITSLFHDIGYGYYHLQEYKQNLCKLYSWLLSPDNIAFDIQSKSLMHSLPAAFIRENHAWLKSSSIEARKEDVVFGFFRDCLPINHSIPSALFVLDLADKVTGARAISPKLYTAFHLAAEAIMIHDMIDKERWLHLTPQRHAENRCHFINIDNHDQFPIAISMILFDQLSRWNSPKLQPISELDRVTYKWNYEKIYKKLEVRIEEIGGKKRLTIIPEKNREDLEEALLKNLFCVLSGRQISLLGYDLEVA